MKKLLTITITIMLMMPQPTYALRPVAMENSLAINAGTFADDEIVVYRNNVPGKPKGQILIRACEISDLNAGERLAAAASLGDWFNCKKGAVYIAPVHVGTIRRIIKHLLCPSSEEDGIFRSLWEGHIYLALSYPEINGKDQIDVEGFVTVGITGENMQITCLEIKPDNIQVGGLDELWPEGFADMVKKLDDLVGVDRDVYYNISYLEQLRARFVGVGRQLLCYAAYRELAHLHGNLSFAIYADYVFEAEEIESGTPCSRSGIIKYINRRNRRTLELLETAAESEDDKGAQDILARLKESDRKGTTFTRRLPAIDIPESLQPCIGKLEEAISVYKQAIAQARAVFYEDMSPPVEGERKLKDEDFDFADACKTIEADARHRRMPCNTWDLQDIARDRGWTMADIIRNFNSPKNIFDKYAQAFAQAMFILKDAVEKMGLPAKECFNIIYENENNFPEQLAKIVLTTLPKDLLEAQPLVADRDISTNILSSA